MLKTKYIGDKFEMLVADSERRHNNDFTTNISNRSPSSSHQPNDVTNITVTNITVTNTELVDPWKQGTVMIQWLKKILMTIRMLKTTSISIQIGLNHFHFRWLQLKTVE